jgi:phosphoribosylamine--glycine ligase
MRGRGRFETLGRVKVLLVGSGGREHALAWKLAQSPALTELHAAPGNPGIAELGSCHPVRADDAEGLLGLCSELAVDLVVVGPEAPLVAGVGDELRHAGVAVFGPGAAAARIEGSKAFAKEVMEAAGVPTARELLRPEAPCVLKADGLAAGKGVFVCRSEAEVAAASEALARLGQPVLVEELLEGDEVSLFALADGEHAAALAPAQDFKRALDGDRGPNTGGMGAYSPVPALQAADAERLVTEIHAPVLAELARRGAPFVGNLYAGLMLTAGGPRVLEFNARFGDPETQALVPRLEGDLLEALAAAATGQVRDLLQEGSEAAVTVVLTGPEYPERSDYAGIPIEGIAEAESVGAIVFQGGTAIRDGGLVTNGGRILSVTALAPELERARQRAYEAVERVRFEGVRYRRDIAAVAGG